MVSDTEIEAAARAIADAWGETWECCCNERRGLDCDCGDAMNDEREAYDERLSREDCRMAARAALSAAARVRAEANAGEPVAWGEDIDGKIVSVRLDKSRHCTVPLYPAPQPSGPVDARIENTDGKKWRVESNDGKWTIQPEGQITADEARALCKRILSALTAGKPRQRRKDREQETD